MKTAKTELLDLARAKLSKRKMIWCPSPCYYCNKQLRAVVALLKKAMKARGDNGR